MGLFGARHSSGDAGSAPAGGPVLASSRAWPPRGVADLLLLEHGHADAPTPSV